MTSYDDYADFSNYRAIAATSALCFVTIRLVVGKKGGVEWDSFLHALVVSAGVVRTLYVDFSTADQIHLFLLPPQMMGCQNSSATLAKLIPAVSLGYAIFDLLEGFSRGPSFVMHGVAYVSVLVIVCEFGLQHTLIPALLLELSTIFFTLTPVTHLGKAFQLMTMLAFALSFFVVRLVLFPTVWAMFLRTAYVNADSLCFPRQFMHVVVLFGIFFHLLNVFWSIKLMKKIIRQLSGVEHAVSKYE